MSYLLKILVTGDSGVGKSTLIHRYVANKFLTGIKGTIGVDFFLKDLTQTEIPDLDSEEELQAQIWDVSGEERFRDILPIYSPGTQGLLLCFETEENLDHLREWEEVLQQLAPPPVPRILVRTKLDLDISIDTHKIKKFQDDYDILSYVETSSKDNTHVAEAFVILSKEIFSAIKQIS